MLELRRPTHELDALSSLMRNRALEEDSFSRERRAGRHKTDLSVVSHALGCSIDSKVDDWLHVYHLIIHSGLLIRKSLALLLLSTYSVGLV